MNPSEEEIRQREASNQNQDGDSSTESTPLEGDDDGADSSLSLPSISKRHLLIVGVVVAVAVVYYLSTRDETGDTLNDAREAEDRHEVDATDTEEEPTISVVHDAEDPLAADASVIEGLRELGVLGGAS